MSKTTTDEKLDHLSETMVKVSWLMRIARESMYASAVETKDFSESAIMTLWLLSVRSPLTLTAIARFLRRSSDRTRQALEPLTSSRLIREYGESTTRFGITEKGTKRLERLISENARRYRRILAGVEPNKNETEYSASYADKILQGLDYHIKTWVLGEAEW